MAMGVTAAIHKPIFTSPQNGEFSVGKVILGNVILGRWSTKVLESGSEAVEQALMQSLR